MRYVVQQSSDYDKRIKIEGNEFSCYSKRQLERMHGKNGYTVVGATKECVKKQHEGKYDEAACGNEYVLSVRKPNSFNPLLFKTVGFLTVGEGKYIKIVADRTPFLIIMLLLLVSIIVALGILIPKLIGGQPINPLPPIDTNVETLPPVPGTETTPIDPEQTEPSPQHKVSMTYMLKADLSISSGRVIVYFGNPVTSDQDIVLELYITEKEGGTLIARSGRVPAGHMIQEMRLEDGIAKRLSEGNYIGHFQVICYDSKTGERAIVEPKITDVAIRALP